MRTSARRMMLFMLLLALTEQFADGPRAFGEATRTTEGFSHDERRWKAGGELMETAFGTPGVGRAGHGRIRPYGMRSTMRERHQRARTKPLGGGGIQR